MLLCAMDGVVCASVDARGVIAGPILWTAAVTAAALDSECDVDGPAVTALARHFKTVLLALEQRRRHTALLACVSSLAEIMDVVNTDSALPGIVLGFRTAALQWRLRCLGGRRTALSHQHFAQPACPACHAIGMYHIPHLVMDCEAYEGERLTAWSHARNVGIEAGLMLEVAVEDNRYYWYRLTMGASVPHSFLAMHLDAPTHFARTVSPPKFDLHVYNRLLGITGGFLCHVMDNVTALLAAPAPVPAAVPIVIIPAAALGVQRWAAHRQAMLDMFPSAAAVVASQGGSVVGPATL